MELKIGMVPASPHRTQGWEPQHQLCPCAFDHFYGHLDQSQGHIHPPAPSEGRAFPTSQQPERNSKGSSEVPALDLKRDITGKGIFKKCQIYKNLHQFLFLIIFSGKLCSESQAFGSVLIPEQQNITSTSARQSLSKAGVVLSTTL